MKDNLRSSSMNNHAFASSHHLHFEALPFMGMMKIITGTWRNSYLLKYLKPRPAAEEELMFGRCFRDGKTIGLTVLWGIWLRQMKKADANCQQRKFLFQKRERKSRKTVQGNRKDSRREDVLPQKNKMVYILKKGDLNEFRKTC